MADEVIIINPDGTTTVSFDVSEWVGQQRKYPKDPHKVPAGLAFYRDEQLAVPGFITAEFDFLQSLTVKALLERSLPKESHSLVYKQAKLCFTHEPPNDGRDEHVETLFQRNIPPAAFIQSALDQVGQALLDGHVSFEDPSYPGSRLAMWELRYWSTLLDLLATRKRWQKALTWLNDNLRQHVRNQVPHTELMQAKSYLLQLRWAEVTRIPGSFHDTTTSEFARLLANTWVSNINMDMMFAQLSERMDTTDTEALDSFVIIETLRVMRELEKADSSKDHRAAPLTPFLRRLEGRIKSMPGDAILVFPAYLADIHHWIAIRIDFGDKSWCYDSLSHKQAPEPRSVIKQINLWLQERFSPEFRCDGNELPHGNQEDATECGIVATNAIAHDVFNDDLWTPSHKVGDRVQWFNYFAKTHISDVRRIVFGYKIDSLTHLDFQVNESTDGLRCRYTIPVDDTPPAGARSIPDLLNPVVDASPPRAGHSKHPPVKPTEGSDTMDIARQRMSVAALLNPISFPVSPPVAPMDIDVELSDACPIPEEGDVGDTMMKLDPEVAGSPAESARADCEELNSESGEPISDTDAGRLEKFIAKVLDIDPQAEIVDAKHVRHFKCGKTLSMKHPHNISNLRTHHRDCRGPPKRGKSWGGSMKTDAFANYFTVPKPATPVPGQGPTSSKAGFKAPPGPCPGLNGATNDDIQQYLDRTGAFGGGGSSVTLLAHALYSSKFGRLSPKRKLQVRLAQRQEWLWINDSTNGVVFSTSCKKVAGARKKSDNSDPPCFNCASLLTKRTFKNLLHRPIPEAADYKYLNYAYRNTQLALVFSKCSGIEDIFIDIKASGDSPLVGYVRTVVQGKNHGAKFLMTLLQAADVQQKRQDAGKGKQGMRYEPKLFEWANIIHSRSPKVYEFMQEYLPLPHVRTLQRNRAREGRFPIGINERTFELVRKHLDQLEYTGPIALSCDDTKLHPAFRPYYDKENDGFYVLGHVGLPQRLANPEAFRRVMEDTELRQGTKLRLWCCQIPLPKVSTIIVAAMCIGESMDTDELTGYLHDIILGFIRHDIMVVSYCADGSSQERSIQDKTEARATEQRTYAIPHPVAGHRAISFDIPIFDGQPIAMLQDSKHLLKTARNNLFSGARLLTFPNGVAMYADILNMAAADDTPLYQKDVINVDRQDDNAAARLFSAASLEWFQEHEPDKLGLIIYLFIMGELVDAYQNRFITISERVKMVLRAYFFLELWQTFLTQAGYSLAKHFVSHQCAAILKRIIFGFLKLLIKDFTMLDFYFMVPKLFILLREYIFRAHSSDGKARASGYSHTYADSRSLNLVALSLYITDAEFEEIAVAAYGEADSLMALLGAPAADLSDTGTSGRSEETLPSIRDWLDLVPEGGEDIYAPEDDEDSHDDAVFDLESDDDEEPGLQSTLDAAEAVTGSDDFESSRLNSLRCAAIAMSTEQENQILGLPEPTEEERTELLAEDAEMIAAFLTPTLPALQIAHEEPSRRIDPLSVDTSQLSVLRRAHQTRQAEFGVRTSKSRHTSKEATIQPHAEPNDDAPYTQSLLDKETDLKKTEVLRELCSIVKEFKKVATGTGVARTVMWTGSTGATASASSGNALNAQSVAKTAATKALNTRRGASRTHSLPAYVEDAGVTIINPLVQARSGRPSGYGFAFNENKLVLVKVLAMHTRSGGKKGTLACVPKSDNIAGTTNIVCQIFEHFHGLNFRPRPARGTRAFQPPCLYGLLLSPQFLHVLKSKPRILASEELALSAEDFENFVTLKSKQNNIAEFVKALTKKTRKGRGKGTGAAADGTALSEDEDN
ncbi:hypothetical protein DFP72DRAFT_1017300 [Ephemerocybe angulata]|uniref:THAP9-like helix-turn-helix domain-containing protein n=1 Tax=Ephemerocybe angulata TaxID=980116 RepID=A0A8H6HIB5_9AGAR|nr:hypothetical protein DFP72DRAFT_1017300 [Tulosesus angulatus]